MNDMTQEARNNESLPPRSIKGAPFAWQDRRVLTRILGFYEGEKKAVAKAIYTTFTEIASERGARKGEEVAVFSASHAEIAAKCGRSVSSVKRYASDFKRMGLLDWRCRKRGRENDYNMWKLAAYNIRYLEPTSLHNSEPAQTAHNSELVRKEGLKKSLIKKRQYNSLEKTDEMFSIKDHLRKRPKP